MKLISLWQPWATLMAIGAKRIETRGWSTDYRGWTAIQATLSWGPESQTMACYPEFVEALKPHYATGHEDDGKWLPALRKELPFGKIVAVGKLVDCLPIDPQGMLDTPLFDGWPSLDTADERAFGNYDDPGRYGLVFKHMFRLPEPIPFKSRQGMMLDVDREVEREIRKQWQEAQS